MPVAPLRSGTALAIRQKPQESQQSQFGILHEASDGGRRKRSGNLPPAGAEEKEGDYLALNYAGIAQSDKPIGGQRECYGARLAWLGQGRAWIDPSTPIAVHDSAGATVILPWSRTT